MRKIDICHNLNTRNIFALISLFFRAKEEVDEIYVLEEELLELIKKDEKNAEKWTELMSFKARKDKWFEKVQSEFECFACYELMLIPLTLPCNHNCCKKCLKKSFKEGHKECWMCREKLEPEDLEEYSNKNLENCLKFLFPALY